MSLDYRVNTTVTGQVVSQDVEAPSLIDGKYELLARRLVDLQDQGIREALIKLGWTPPNEAPKRKVFGPQDIRSWSITPDSLTFRHVLYGITRCGSRVQIELNDNAGLTNLEAVQMLVQKLNEVQP